MPRRQQRYPALKGRPSSLAELNASFGSLPIPPVGSAKTEWTDATAPKNMSGYSERWGHVDVVKHPDRLN